MNEKGNTAVHGEDRSQGRQGRKGNSSTKEVSEKCCYSQMEEAYRKRLNEFHNKDYSHLSLAEVRRKLPEYIVWKGIKQRCSNPNHSRFSWYGGRGITICDEWNSFERFIEDMGFRPSEEYEIDRIDNDSGYSKQNCRWVSHLVNSRNSSWTKITEQQAAEIKILLNQGHKTQKEIGEIYGLPQPAISKIKRGLTWVKTAPIEELAKEQP